MTVVFNAMHIAYKELWTVQEVYDCYKITWFMYISADIFLICHIDFDEKSFFWWNQWMNSDGITSTKGRNHRCHCYVFWLEESSLILQHFVSDALIINFVFKFWCLNEMKQFIWVKYHGVPPVVDCFYCDIFIWKYFNQSFMY